MVSNQLHTYLNDFSVQDVIPLTYDQSTATTATPQPDVSENSTRHIKRCKVTNALPTPKSSDSGTTRPSAGDDYVTRPTARYLQETTGNQKKMVIKSSLNSSLHKYVV